MSLPTLNKKGHKVEIRHLHNGDIPAIKKLIKAKEAYEEVKEFMNFKGLKVGIFLDNKLVAFMVMAIGTNVKSAYIAYAHWEERARRFIGVFLKWFNEEFRGWSLFLYSKPKKLYRWKNHVIKTDEEDVYQYTGVM